MQVTIGGDRLGSGKKVKTALKEYERSTHDLSQKFTSSLQCGTLYPFLVLPAMRGDKFDIDLSAAARTIPTKGPLFGSFKMQVDLFQCDVRLYQAILHNNPLAIGLKMNQVKFPVLRIYDDQWNAPFSNTCLLKYLGMSGLGIITRDMQQHAYREINAIPALAYYEIFKTYYSNKQEEKAYIIGNETKEFSIEDLIVNKYTNNELDETFTADEGSIFITQTFEFTNEYAFDNLKNNLYVTLFYNNNNSQSYKACYTFSELEEKNIIKIKNNKYYFASHVVPGQEAVFNTITFSTNFRASAETEKEINYTTSSWGLQPFTLSNIDDMRLKLLSFHTLGSSFRIDPEIAPEQNDGWGNEDGADGDGLPYNNLVAGLGNDMGATMNINPLNGLVVKTYQSDLFNNWVNTEWIDGENGIAEVTAVSTQDDKVLIDSLNLAEKLYNMLNRIAVSDGSYEGWQDAVYTETPKRHIESPVYLGGMSSEIMFEEIVQTSADGEGLGTLAGKGVLIKRKGGHVTVKCNEACFIIGIVSLTPRVNYCQGNEWYLTELKSMDDFHKPALDGIGFQNLIGERLAWWDTKITGGTITSRSTVGKVPAWIEYMTAVDKCFGDFAETEGRGFMALQRDYGRTIDNEIADATTYIDPRKFNYAFAYTNIDAQNFWVQIYSNIKARRLMSAKQIPNI